jgi:hypothetical protein
VSARTFARRVIAVLRRDGFPTWEGEYEKLLALHAEGRMGLEVPLGDVTIDPDESTSP